MQCIDKTSFKYYTKQELATLAQLVEHLIRNERVVGSNPISGSKNSFYEEFFFLNKISRRASTLSYLFYISSSIPSLSSDSKILQIQGLESTIAEIFRSTNFQNPIDTKMPIIAPPIAQRTILYPNSIPIP